MTKAYALIAGASFLAISSTAMAQASGPADAGAQVDEASGSGAGEIIVTARRKDELLQDVPQSITAVTGEDLQRLNITRIEDIEQVVPGLSFSGQNATIRGVSYNGLASTNATIMFYLNDTPVGGTAEVLRSTFDVGQIEVLRGPQGTLRGKSAPSGAITVTTRRPDLNEFGGYVNISGDTSQSYNLQAAASIPIIADTLALRLAGVYDRDRPEVRSINSIENPIQKLEGFRATLRFEPSSNFSAVFMYQYLNIRNRTFNSQVTGAGGGANPGNPAIGPGDRLSVADVPSIFNSISHMLTAQIDWKFAGQKLSYVGGYRKPGYGGQDQSYNPIDSSNVIPNFDFYSSIISGQEEMTHELRLSSDDRVAGIFDYTIGGFLSNVHSKTDYTLPVALLSGAFGPPGTTGPGPVNQRYVLNYLINTAPSEYERSLFGNVTAHIGEKTEISAGLRYIHFKKDFPISIGTGAGFNAVGFPCGFIPPPTQTTPSPYPGACDVVIPANPSLSRLPDQIDKPLLYSVSATHRFSDDLMVYGSVGTAYRVGGLSIGVQGAVNCCGGGNPDLRDLSDLVTNRGERSTSYELGFKSTFFDKRLRFNVSVYRQKFKDFAISASPAVYLAVTDPNAPLTGANVNTTNTFSFVSSADAQVDGFEIELGIKPSSRFSIDAGFSWSKSKLTGGNLPCSDFDFDGIANRFDPDFVVGTPNPSPAAFISRGIMVARCAVNGGDSVSTQPRWNLTLQSEYKAPISSRSEVFLRGNLTYYPRNPYQSEFYVINSYMLANVYAGVRATDGSWEISAFAKAVNKPDEILSLGGSPANSGAGLNNTFGASNYVSVSFTPRTRVGLNLRYAFGSR